MTVDEELLARAQAGDDMPVLRFYTWDPPAVSLGRFQTAETSVNADACKRLGFDVVRRITGGRAVLHRRELTYSIVSRIDNPLFPPDVLGTYKVIAAGLLAGLANLGIDAEMVSRGGRHAALVNKTDKDPSCFASPSWYEIVVHGKKIVGSAQRRLSHAFLQHGSILIDYDPALEAEVIRGGGSGDARHVHRSGTRARSVSCDEVKRASFPASRRRWEFTCENASVASHASPVSSYCHCGLDPESMLTLSFRQPMDTRFREYDRIKTPRQALPLIAFPAVFLYYYNMAAKKSPARKIVKKKPARSDQPRRSKPAPKPSLSRAA